ncbi:MAG: trehalose-phosphatase [Actinobacteria bacterium]|nr:trehalose-phosphatase [Actinomycetota bacterium]
MTGKSLHNNKLKPTSLEETQEALAPLLTDTSAAAIFLDLDGTLAPIMPRPDDVAIQPDIARLIRHLAHRYKAVTIVSGRPATGAKRIVGNSELAYIGNHGFETLLPGHAVVVHDEAQPYIPRIKELIEYCRKFEELPEQGIWLEDKTATMSFHFRRAADPQQAIDFIHKNFFPRIEELELAVTEGRKVIEVRPPVPVNKGVAVGRLLDRLDCRRAIYIGDDTTDVDALKELRKRKRRKDSFMVGVGVISDEMPAELPRYADLMVERMSGVEQVLQILSGEEL